MRETFFSPWKAAPLILFLSFLFMPFSSSPLGAQQLDVLLDEIEQLIADKDFTTALEDLKFLAQQIQDLRLREAAAFFPEAPEGWMADEALRTSREEEPWSRRLEARRRYLPAKGTGKVEIAFDFHSSLLPAVTMSLNPVYIAGDRFSESFEQAGWPGRIHFNSDTGEGEILLIVDRRILVTVLGRGIAGRAVLQEFISLVDLRTLSSFNLP